MNERMDGLISGKPMLLTTGEKERIFMDAVQSFYYNQRQMLDDDDFDKLKEDLAWEGSQVKNNPKRNIRILIHIRSIYLYIYTRTYPLHKHVSETFANTCPRRTSPGSGAR